MHDRTPYHFKRHAIQNCLYGVDIDPGAVEIAKLRLWLSLVVDEDDVKQIKPLPNLDYKIVTGNSLLGVQEEPPQRWICSTGWRNSNLATSTPLTGSKRKDSSRKLTTSSTNSPTARRTSTSRSISPRSWTPNGAGFDVVIGNPPYVRQEAIKGLKPALKAKGYECFDAVADLLVYFYERGVTLLRRGGTIALITSNKFYRAGYGAKLRRFLGRELTLHRLIDFGDAPVFEAIAYASILIGVRSAPDGDASALAYTWESEMSFDRIAQVLPERGQQVRQIELKAEGWQLESPATFRLLEKIRHAGKPLGEYVGGRLYRGILTGLNEAFVVDKATRDRLVREHKSSGELLKPFLRGRDVKRWRVVTAGQYLIKIESSENKKHMWSDKSEAEAGKVFSRAYPAIHEHFQSLRAIKLDEPDARGCRNMFEKLQRRDDQGRFFWELRSCVYWNQFEQSKIVIPAIAKTVQYAADDHKFYSNDKTSICGTSEPNYLLGLLNSRVLWWLIRQTAASKQGGFYEFKPMYVSALPIPKVSSEKQKPVERLVERILAAKQQDAEANVSDLEQEIDDLVYALYGLTAAEKAIVEAATAD